MYHIFYNTYKNLYYYADEEGFSSYTNSLQKLLDTPKEYSYQNQNNFTSLQRIFELMGTRDWKGTTHIASVKTLNNLPIDYPELFI